MAANTKKDNGTTALLMIVAGVLLALLTYLYVFNPCMEKKNSYNEEVKTLNNLIAERESKKSLEEKYKADTKNFEASREKVLQYFPVDIKAEDDLLFCKEVENSTDFYFTTKGVFSSPIIFYADNASSLVGYTRVCGYEFATSYASLKDMLDYINYYKYRRSISELSVSYENGGLSGEMIVNEYYVVGGDKEYKSPTVDGVTLGNDNPFDTIVELGKDDYDVIFK